MPGYHVVLLISCIASTCFGTMVLMRDSGERANRIAAGIIFGGAWWAFCELLWNQSHDRESALALIKLSVFGWAWIGPLALQLMIELVGEPLPRMRRLCRALYVFAAIYLLLVLFTPWVHTSVTRTDWGWSYTLGPAYPIYYLTTVTAILAGLGLAYRAYRSWPSEGERRQARGIAVGILVPLVVASVTDGVLPYMGVHVHHFGTAAVSVLAATVAFTFYRYGYSLLAPGTFAREILETMPDGLALLHLDGRIRQLNPAMIAMAGSHASASLDGIGIERLLAGIDVTGLRDGQRAELRFTPLHGAPFPVEVSATNLNDRQGSPVGRVVVVHDQREVVELRHRLMISGRMAAVGQLAAGVAHELNNPMAYVRANLSLLEKHVGSLDGALQCGPEERALLGECGELIEESIDGVDRASAIVRDIRSFSHAGTAEREVVDLRTLVEATLRIAATNVRHRARFETVYGPNVSVYAAPREIQQVLLNLILNAVDACEAEGGSPREPIRIATGCDEELAWLEIRDRGTGIPADLLDRIFDPFFTTKPAGKGTGIGLSLSYEIVRRHGGELQVESEAGEGTCFRVVLPRARD